MIARRTAVTVLASAAVALSGLSANAVNGAHHGAGDVRMNQVQFIGAHNAYHRELSDKEKTLQLSLDAGSKDLFYSHAAIPDQLAAQNVRSLELDLFPDPQGGLYQWPLIRKLAAMGPLTDPDLAKPGIKVMHIADFDYNTTCSTFVKCLRLLKTWQDANPKSAPVVVQLELKQSDPRIVAAGGVQSPPWNAANLDGVDTEIRSVFGEDRLLSPDDVRRAGLTLEQSVLQKGWPKLDAVRGKVMFFFDNGGPGEIRDLYTAGRPNLEGRAVFTQGPEGAPDAAVTQVNDPRGDGTATIQRLVRKGYFVRTRSDESLSTVLNNETSRVGIALASGAQMVTTDFPVAGMSARYDRDFVADLPGPGALRCNPVTATPKCHSDRLEK